MHVAYLVKQAKSGDEEAFSRLINRFLQLFYRTAFSIMHNEHDSNDAVQKAIVSIWKKLPQLKKNGSFKYWALRILTNKCYETLRSRRDAPLEAASEVTETNSFGRIVWEDLIQSLDPRYRVTMQLYYGARLRTREIAELLDIPKSTVTTYLARGRKQAESYYRAAEKRGHDEE